jgi:hypothetical protein
MLRVIVRNSKALVASKVYHLGDVIRSLEGSTTTPFPNSASIQVGPAQHVEDEYGSWMNHSCLPNTTIFNRQILAIKTIQPGTELTYNYVKTEACLNEPIECFRCGTLIEGKNTKCPVYKIHT